MKIALSKIQVVLPASQRELFKINSLQIQQGEHVLFKGASGKGKTTLLHLMAGLFLPTQGHVQIGETSLTSMSDEERCQFRREHVGLIFQKLNLIDHLTAIENVQLSLRPESQKSSEASHQALLAVGLSERKHDRTSILSLGEQQRVAVARVMAQSPAIILADEPTSSLDEVNAQRVMELLIANARGKTLVVVSHDHRVEKNFSIIHRFEDLIS